MTTNIHLKGDTLIITGPLVRPFLQLMANVLDDHGVKPMLDPVKEIYQPTGDWAEKLLLKIYDFSDEGFEKYKTNRLTNIHESSITISEVITEVHKYDPSLKPKSIKQATIALLKHHTPGIYVSSKLIKNGTYLVGSQVRYFMPALKGTIVQVQKGPVIDTPIGRIQLNI